MCAADIILLHSIIMTILLFHGIIILIMITY